MTTHTAGVSRVRFTTSSYPTDRRNQDGKPLLRWTVWEDTVAIYDTDSKQDADRYADALSRRAAQLAG